MKNDEINRQLEALLTEYNQISEMRKELLLKPFTAVSLAVTIGAGLLAVSDFDPITICIAGNFGLILITIFLLWCHTFGSGLSLQLSRTEYKIRRLLKVSNKTSVSFYINTTGRSNSKDIWPGFGYASALTTAAAGTVWFICIYVIWSNWKEVLAWSFPVSYLTLLLPVLTFVIGSFTAYHLREVESDVLKRRRSIRNEQD